MSTPNWGARRTVRPAHGSSDDTTWKETDSPHSRCGPFVASRVLCVDESCTGVGNDLAACIPALLSPFRFMASRTFLHARLGIVFHRSALRRGAGCDLLCGISARSCAVYAAVEREERVDSRRVRQSTYAYANGDPVSFRDPFGLKPGDPFGSIQAAAIDALDWVYQTYPNATEYAGSIYQDPSGQYIATNPSPGSGDSSAPSVVLHN